MNANGNGNIIELHSVRKVYDTGKVKVEALRGVDLKVRKGEFLTLVGPSGSGKSTMMNILGCLDVPSDGTYLFGHEEVNKLTINRLAEIRNHHIGFVFQNFNLLARTSAIGNVLVPLLYATESISDREARRRAVTMLDRVGLSDRMDHEPSQLSGGQQQRVAIARALVNRPSLLFADEPTGNLDSHTSEEILQMFQQLNKEEGITIILVTHDASVARHARRVIQIRDGMIEDDSPASASNTAPEVGHGSHSSPKGALR